MRLNTAKTRVVLYSRKTNVLSYEYQLCHAAITRTSSIKDLGVFFDSKLHFHNHDDFTVSKCIKLLGLIRSTTFRVCSLNCLYVLYFTLVSPSWNIPRQFGILSHLPMPTSLSASSRNLRPSVSTVFPSRSLQLYFCLREIRSTFFT
jgi:hypothetical protein